MENLRSSTVVNTMVEIQNLFETCLRGLGFAHHSLITLVQACLNNNNAYSPFKQERYTPALWSKIGPSQYTIYGAPPPPNTHKIHRGGGRKIVTLGKYQSVTLCVSVLTLAVEQVVSAQFSFTLATGSTRSSSSL